MDAFHAIAGSISGDLVWTLRKMGHNGTNVDFEKKLRFAVQSRIVRYHAVFWLQSGGCKVQDGVFLMRENHAGESEGATTNSHQWTRRGMTKNGTQ